MISRFISTKGSIINKTIIRSMSGNNKFKVFVTRNDIPKEGVDLLRQNECDIEIWNHASQVPREELIKRVTGKDALFCLLTDKIDKTVIDAAGKQLKVVGTMSVGYDHVDVNLLKERKIKLGYTPDILTDAVAELTVALVLATGRRLFEASKAVYSGEWGVWSPVWMCGKGLAGSTVGIIGLGRIGQAVATRIKTFNPNKIIYTGRASRSDAPEWAEFKDMNTFLKESDFVIVLCSLTPETNKLCNAEFFSKMKKGAIFINTSRGAVVDQDALLQTLKSGHLSAAGLDVTDPEPLPTNHPLLSLSNCVVLPHIGSATIATRTAMSIATAKNILAALKNETMIAQVC